jgi:hypothetical protein
MTMKNLILSLLILAGASALACEMHEPKPAVKVDKAEKKPVVAPSPKQAASKPKA